MPKVSVIIPVYNVEKYLRKCMDSIVNQTLFDIEIICVDDKSTDNSLEILKEYAEKDDRIKIIEQKVNMGPGISRNRALNESTGDYIMFLDSDDWLELSACEDAYNQILKYNNDFVYFNIKYFFEKENKSIIDEARLGQFKSNLTDNNINLRNLRNPFMQYAECWYKIYKRSFLEDNNIIFSEDRFVEDMIFYAKAIANSKSVSVLNKPLYNYRIRENSLVSQSKYYKILIDARCKFYNVFKNTYDNEYLLKYAAICSINSLIGWYNTWTKKNKRIRKDFYERIRIIFLEYDKEYDLSEFKDYIQYEKTINIINYNYYKYQFVQFINNIFSIRDIKKNNKEYKEFRILGLKIKIHKQ